MKKAEVNDMELGNLIFGNSRGEYLVEPREDYQNEFCTFLFDHGFDGYGFKMGSKSGTFENDTFIIRTYYWGEDEKIASLPNFVYKPTGLEINWYKYPMRDAYSNQDIDIDTFVGILKDCSESLKKERVPLKPLCKWLAEYTTPPGNTDRLVAMYGSIEKAWEVAIRDHIDI